MRFCFIVEEQYRNDPMPMVIADQLLQWGHDVDLLEPQGAVTCLSDLADQGYDAYILKSLADGPGLSILEAAEAVGIPTINSARSIRLVRDKAVAAAFAYAHGLPIPPTYFVAHPRLLKQIPIEDYPLVIKPSNGSSNQGVYLLESPEDLVTLEIAEAKESFFLAQRYAENTGYDIKVYVTGREVYAAIAKKSILHPDMGQHFVPLTPQVRKLALQVGKLFGLDIYGVDIVETPQGPAIVDINDFPSFGGVPRAVIRVSEYVLHTAKRAEMQRAERIKRVRQTLAANKSRESILEKPITPPDSEKEQGDLGWRTDLQPVGSIALHADQQTFSGALSQPGAEGGISQSITADSQSPVSTSGSAVETVQCFRCGAANQSDRLFCTSCGYELPDKWAATDRYIGPNGRPVLARLSIRSVPMAGRSYLFHQVVTTIGRINGNDLILSGRTVSRRHARLWFEGGRWYLEDMQSANGTLVNNMRLQPNQAAPLNDSDVINFGDEIVVFHEVNGESTLLPGNIIDTISSKEELKTIKSSEETHLSLFAIAHAELEEGNVAFIGKTYSLHAGISQFKPKSKAESIQVGSIQIKPEAFDEEPFDIAISSIDESISFDILLHTSNNIELITDWYKRLQYNPRDLGPQLVEFTFQVEASEQSFLVIDFYHERRWLRSMRLEFNAVEESQLTAISSKG